jgi:hypothetical protein
MAGCGTGTQIVSCDPKIGEGCCNSDVVHPRLIMRLVDSKKEGGYVTR